MLIFGIIMAVLGIFGGLQALGILSGVPVFAFGIPAVLSVYFDLFSGFVQALVFTILTTSMQPFVALAEKLFIQSPPRVISELKFAPNAILSLPVNRNSLMPADVLINSKSVLNPRDNSLYRGFMSGKAPKVFPALFLSVRRVFRLRR